MKHLFVDTVTTICRAHYTDEQLRVWASSANNSERWNGIVNDQYLILAELGEKLVGFASLGGDGYVDLFYVHKDHQRQGIARALYETIEQEAMRLGTEKLVADVSKTARPFFEAVGFQVMDEQTVVRERVSLTNFRMVKLF